MLKRLILLGVIMSLTLPLYAQDVECSLMNEDDCATLQTAVDNMLELGAVNMANYAIEFGGSGGESDGNALILNGSGALEYDAEGIYAMRLDAEGGLTSEESAVAQVILQDDVFYRQQNDEGWQGVPATVENGEFFIDLFTGNLILNAFAADSSVAMERAEDIERDGQTMLVYRGNVDLPAFLSSPEMVSMLEETLLSMDTGDLGGQFGNDFDIAGAIPLLTALLTRETAEIELWVGGDDAYIHRIDILVDLALNASIADPNLGEVGFLFDFETDLDGFGEDFAIAAPEDYEELDDFGFDLEEIAGTAFPGADPVPQADNLRYAVEESIAYGDSVTGTLADDNTEDIWGFEASAGDVVTITMQAVGDNSSLDTTLTLRDPDGVELTANDDHNGVEGLGIFDSQITAYEISADGEYRIVATWLTPTRDGAYELTLERAE